uniref:Transmembrane protein n=1 Tax=Plectus sambesii TaxID=2011161 RepID=A0A914USN5_9BILA
MATTSDSKDSWTVKRVFPPVNWQTVTRHYLPVTGAISHGCFASHVLTPAYLYRLFPYYDMAVGNVILFNAHLGIGFYVYYRAHMLRVAPRTRVMFSVFSSVMFNFGSVLLFATTKAVLPRNGLIKTIFGCLTSLALLSIGREYLTYIDSLIK